MNIPSNPPLVKAALSFLLIGNAAFAKVEVEKQRRSYTGMSYDSHMYETNVFSQLSASM